MSGLRLLDGVDGEETDGVDAELFQLVFLPDERAIAVFCDGDGGGTFSRGAASAMAA